MSFLNPLAFLFLLSVPGLVLLYFLKLKRPQVDVPSTLLWQKVIEDMRVNSPFQKLKRSLLLLLQLLALLAAIFALARPLLRVRRSFNESIIVLLDQSASMMTVEENGKTRLEIAKGHLGEVIDHLSKDQEMMILTFSEKAKAACAFTSNRRRLQEALSGVEAVECPTRIEPALLLAKSIANSRKKPRLVVLSDGAFDTSRRIELPVEIEYQQVGSRRPNLAITGLDIRRSLSDRNKIEMFVAVENFSTEKFAGNMVVHLGGDVLDSKYFSVGPEETLSQIFEAILPSGGEIKVEFEVKDALRCDNRAWKVVPPPLHRRVLVVGENNFFIERAFKASRAVECEAVMPAAYSLEAAAGACAVIWNNVAKPGIAECDNIYLGCFPEMEGLAQGTKIDAPDVLDWDNTHPLNRFLDFDNLVLSSTIAMTLPETAAGTLRSSRTPLIAVMDGGGGSMCVTGFNPLESNWPLLASFPLFLNNCLDHFEERRRRKIESNIPVGKTITAPEGTGAPTVRLPSGEEKRMVRNSAGDYCFTAVDACGIYRISVPGLGETSVAANLFDRNESRLETVEDPVIGEKAVGSMPVHRRVNREYWHYLVMAVGLLLVFEWIAYHRRLFV